MAIESIDNLITVLDETQLLEAPQRAELIGPLRDKFEDPRSLARALIERGWLTPFHVNQLFQGRAHELILGPYVILERIGEGGMGQVFKARHSKLGRVVALKVIRKEYLSNPDAVRRFHREIRAVAQLSHPNIVLALDAEQVGGTHYIVMEFVDGIDLDKLLKQSGPLAVAQACDYARQAALGLQHAHERHLVHRDIKPSNLLITQMPGRPGAGGRKSGLAPPNAPWGIVKLLDMGVARTRGDAANAEHTATLTQAGAMVGTPDYTAPEQARDAHTVDIRADVYSLGCTLYQMLTGKVPFPGGTGMEKLFRHQLETPQPLEELRAGLPTGLGDVVRWMMAREPEKRPQTPAELATALEPFAGVPPAPYRLPPTARPGGADPTEDSRSALVTTPPQAPPRPAKESTPRPRTGIKAAAPAVKPRTAIPPVAVTPTAPITKKSKPRPVLAMVLVGSLGLMGFLLFGLVVLALVSGKKSNSVVENPPTSASKPDNRAPLDRLDAANIPAAERLPGMPPEVVAVIGSQRFHGWGAGVHMAGGQPIFSPDSRLVATGGFTLSPLWQVPSGDLFPRSPRVTGCSSAAFSSDGKTLYAVSFQVGTGAVTVRAHDLTNGTERPLIVQGPGTAYTLAPSGDLAIVTDGKSARVYDLARGADRCILVEAEPFGAYRFSPDGQYALGVAGFGRTPFPAPIRLPEPAPAPAPPIKLPEAAPVPPGKPEPAGAEVPVGPKKAALHDRIDRLIAADQPAMMVPCKLFDLQTGKLIATLKADGYPYWQGVSNGANRVVYLLRPPLGKSVQVHIWDRQKNEERAPLNISGDLTGMPALSPDGATLAFIVGSDLKIVDLNTGAERGLSALDTKQVTLALTFSPDGKTLALSGSDFFLHLWDVASGREINRSTDPARIVGPASLKDGQSVGAFTQMGASPPPGTAPLTWASWPLPGLTPAKSVNLAAVGNPIAILKGGKQALVHRTRDLAIVDLETGAVTATTELPNSAWVALSEDESVAYSMSAPIGVWELPSLKPRPPLENNPAMANGVTVSRNGDFLVCMEYKRKTLRCWDTRTGKEKPGDLTIDGYASQMAISPDGKIIVAAGNTLVFPPRTTLKVWDARGGAPRITTSDLGSDYATTLRILADGKSLLYLRKQGPVVLDLDTGAERAFKQDSPTPYARLEVSPDGKLVAGTDYQGRLSVWKVADGSLVSHIALFGPVLSLGFADDNRHLTTVNGNGTMYIIRLAPPPL
jgi:serine/threonine-protein kinase